MIDELDILEAEWMTALPFLTEIGKANEFILLSDVLGISVFVNDRSHPSSERTTAANVLGPSYLEDVPLLEAPYRLATEEEPGEPLFFEGRVTDAVSGVALAGALLDVWQADDAALYDVQRPGSGPHLRGRFRPTRRVRSNFGRSFRPLTRFQRMDLWGDYSRYWAGTLGGLRTCT